MAEDAQFLVMTAVEYAERRGGRLRAITFSAPTRAPLARLHEALAAAGLTDVEVHWERAEEGLRLVAVEVESAA